ncbi:hypothetical protein CKW39_05650 [Kocuria sp. WRN011]|uniref:Uncharacterized protein n=1 Tax=Kocuria carniphila TaxID=262208 RepID=A0ABV3V211_9MICC|nr:MULTISPECIES: hypothetical protein [Kocuria]MCT1801814.1 hypothetical protein [Kocuria carniphila]PBB09036.1 hypothetical protein CKW39_05650 [Kocuria sp. WRN011]PZP30040.1 MAG: hypothetical protein DI613_11130 [Kocuria rhizophila]
MNRIIDFLGLRSDSPEDSFWYGFDRKLKAKLIAMSLILAVAVFAVAHFLFRGIDMFPVILPWALALLAFTWSLSVAKNKHRGSNGQV